MPDISLKNGSLADLGAFALGLGDPAFKENAEELRSLAEENVAQDFSPANSGRPEGLRYKVASDKTLALALKTAWSELYGPDVSLWPENLKDALETINLGIGLASFENNLTSAFQNLRPYEETVPALEVGMAVVAPFMGPDSPINRATTNGFIPESAARAGLSFISSPFSLVAPIVAAGFAGRAVTGLTANAGRALSLADEAIAGAATLFGLIGESAGFVATGDAIQYVAEGFSPPSETWNAKAFRYEGSFIQETFASTLFFGALRMFGAAGRFTASMLPATAEGMALAKLTGHAASVLGLATTEEVQERMGGAMNNVAEGFSLPQESWNPEGFRYTSERTFTAKLWRALFLHTTLQATTEFINLKGVQSENVAERFSVPSGSWNPEGFRYESTFIPELVAAMAGKAGASPEIFRSVLKMAMSDEGPGPKSAQGRSQKWGWTKIRNRIRDMAGVNVELDNVTLTTSSKDILKRTRIDWEGRQITDSPVRSSSLKLGSLDLGKNLQIGKDLKMDSIVKIDIGGTSAYALFMSDDDTSHIFLSFTRPTADRVNCDAVISYYVQGEELVLNYYGVGKPVRGKGLEVLLEHLAYVTAKKPDRISVPWIVSTNPFRQKLRRLEKEHPQWPDLAAVESIRGHYEGITGRAVTEAKAWGSKDVYEFTVTLGGDLSDSKPVRPAETATPETELPKPDPRSEPQSPVVEQKLASDRPIHWVVGDRVRADFKLRLRSATTEADFIKWSKAIALHATSDAVRFYISEIGADQVTTDRITEDYFGSDRDAEMQREGEMAVALRKKTDGAPDREGHVKISFKRIRDYHDRVVSYRVLAKFPDGKIIYFEPENACVMHAIDDLYKLRGTDGVAYVPALALDGAVAKLEGVSLGQTEFLLERGPDGSKRTQDPGNYLYLALIGHFTNERLRVQISDLWNGQKGKSETGPVTPDSASAPARSAEGRPAYSIAYAGADGVDSLQPILRQWVRKGLDGQPMQEDIKEATERLSRGIPKGTHKVLVAKDESGVVIGFFAYSGQVSEIRKLARTKEPIELTDVYVDSGNIRRGIGTALMKRLEADARGQGATEILIGSAPWFKESGWGFYDSLPGFERVGAVMNYGKMGQNAQVWSKVLEADHAPARPAEEAPPTTELPKPDPKTNVASVAEAQERLASSLGDGELLNALVNENPKGSMITIRDDKLDTDIHFAVSSSTQINNGEFEHVPLNSNSIGVFFHGSGTKAAYGGTFYQVMNSILPYGIASIAADHPFHRNGSRDRELRKTEKFMAKVDETVGRYRKKYPDKKVVLVGHSYGGMILEYLARYPKGADAVILFAPVLRYNTKWVEHISSPEVLELLSVPYEGGEVFIDAQADIWAERVLYDSTFMRRPPPDIPILLVTGGDDVWLPDKDVLKAVQEHYPTLKVFVLPKVGHHDFFTTNANELPEQIRQQLFMAEPPAKGAGLMAWTIIDFIGRHFNGGNSLTPREGTKDLNFAQRALLLHMMNPAFRALFPDARALENGETARLALALWEELRKTVFDRTLQTVSEKYTEFYNANKEAFDLLSPPDGKKLTRKEQGRHTYQKNVLMAKLVKWLNAKKSEIAQSSRKGFGVTATGLDGSVGKNHWTRTTYQNLKDALSAIDRRWPRGIWPQKALVPDGFSEHLRYSLGSTVAKLTEIMVKFLHISPRPYESSLSILNVRNTFLGEVRDKLNIGAQRVLVVSSSGDIVTPMRLFKDATGLIAIGKDNFGLPESWLPKISPEGLMSARLASVYGWDRNVGGKNGGGEMLNRIVAGLDAREILGIYYFAITPDGKKSYLDPITDVEEPIGTELRFVDADGVDKTVDFLRSDQKNLPSNVMSYLGGAGIGAIYAADGTTALETEPKGVLQLRELMAGGDIPLVTGNRRPNSHMKRVSPSDKPAAFIDDKTAARFDLSELVQRYKTGFQSGTTIYVVRAGDIKESWRHEDTWARRQHTLDESVPSSLSPMEPTSPIRNASDPQDGTVYRLEACDKSPSRGEGGPEGDEKSLIRKFIDDENGSIIPANWSWKKISERLVRAARSVFGGDSVPVIETSSADRVATPPSLEDLLATLSVRNTIDLVSGDLREGNMIKRHMPQFDTNFYFSVTSSTEIHNGHLDEVSRDANVILLLAHGAGTPSANGASFIAEINTLNKHGIAAISVDLPFHGGPKGEEFYTGEGLANWVASITQYLRDKYPGKKILLAGHSFGPDVILETVTRHPNAADGIAGFSMVSPLIPEIAKHYKEHTLNLLDKEHAETLAEGELFQMVLDRGGFTFAKRPAPPIPMLIVNGEQEQWLPDPYQMQALLKGLYPNMDVRVVPGLDHHGCFRTVVQNMGEDARRIAFGDSGMNPPGKETRFFIWSIVNFVTEHFGPIVSPAPQESVKKLTDVQTAHMLQERNDAFRALVQPAGDLLTDDGAKKALSLWNSFKQTKLSEVVRGIADTYSDFYREYQPLIDEVLGKLERFETLSKGQKTRFLQDRSLILNKLRSYLARLEETGGSHEDAKAINEGVSEWHQRTYEALKVAMAEYISGSLRGKGKNRRISADAARKAGLGRFEEVRDEMNLFARNVISIFDGLDLVRPFCVFDGTQKVIAVTNIPLVGPERLVADWGTEQVAASYERRSDRKTTSAEGTALLQLSVEMGIQDIKALYYFTLDGAGRKEYVPWDKAQAEGRGSIGAEISFVDNDGRPKVLELISGDANAPTDGQLVYLSGHKDSAVFAGEGLDGIEARPAAVRMWREFLRASGTDIVTVDRRPNQWKGTMPSRRPPAFFDQSTLQKYGEETPFYVGDHRTILPAWRRGATREGVQEYYDGLMAELRFTRGGTLGSPSAPVVNENVVYRLGSVKEPDPARPPLHQTVQRPAEMTDEPARMVEVETPYVFRSEDIYLRKLDPSAIVDIDKHEQVEPSIRSRGGRVLNENALGNCVSWMGNRLGLALDGSGLSLATFLAHIFKSGRPVKAEDARIGDAVLYVQEETELARTIHFYYSFADILGRGRDDTYIKVDDRLYGVKHVGMVGAVKDGRVMVWSKWGTHPVFEAPIDVNASKWGDRAIVIRMAEEAKEPTADPASSSEVAGSPATASDPARSVELAAPPQITELRKPDPTDPTDKIYSSGDRQTLVEYIPFDSSEFNEKLKALRASGRWPEGQIDKLWARSQMYAEIILARGGRVLDVTAQHDSMSVCFDLALGMTKEDVPPSEVIDKNYIPVQTPRVGDILVYYDSKQTFQEKPLVAHAAIVSEIDPDKGKVTKVFSKFDASWRTFEASPNDVPSAYGDMYAVFSLDPSKDPEGLRRNSIIKNVKLAGNADFADKLRVIYFPDGECVDTSSKPIPPASGDGIEVVKEGDQKTVTIKTDPADPELAMRAVFEDDNDPFATVFKKHYAQKYPPSAGMAFSFTYEYTSTKPPRRFIRQFKIMSGIGTGDPKPVLLGESGADGTVFITEVFEGQILSHQLYPAEPTPPADGKPKVGPDGPGPGGDLNTLSIFPGFNVIGKMLRPVGERLVRAARSVFGGSDVTEQPSVVPEKTPESAPRPVRPIDKVRETELVNRLFYPEELFDGGKVVFLGGWGDSLKNGPIDGVRQVFMEKGLSPQIDVVDLKSKESEQVELRWGMTEVRGGEPSQVSYHHMEFNKYLPGREGSASVVYVIYPHLGSAPDFLSTALKLAKPGGRIVFVTEDTESVRSVEKTLGEVGVKFIGWDNFGSELLPTTAFSFSPLRSVHIRLITMPERKEARNPAKDPVEEVAPQITELPKPDPKTTDKGKFGDIAKKSAMALFGLAIEPEDWLTRFYQMLVLTPIRMVRREPTFLVTARSPLKYMMGLDLFSYDFDGKWVLDIGSGKSRFTQSLGLLYGNTGTVAVAIDKCTQPRGSRSALGLKLDAVDIPLMSGTFDLVVSNWALGHLWGDPSAEFVMEEMIRLCKPGGEIRVTYLNGHGSEWMKDYFGRHPAVAEVVDLPDRLNALIKIKMKDVPPSDTELIDFFQALENEGWVSVPWRTELFEPESVSNKIEKLRQGGLSSETDRLAYLGHLRRLYHRARALEAKGPDSELLKPVHRWVADGAISPKLKFALATFYLEDLDNFGGRFLSIWEKLDDKDREDSMLYWLNRWTYREFFANYRDIFKEVRGNYSEEVQKLQGLVDERIKYLQWLNDARAGAGGPF